MGIEPLLFYKDTCMGKRVVDRIVINSCFWEHKFLILMSLKNWVRKLASESPLRENKTWNSWAPHTFFGVHNNNIMSPNFSRVFDAMYLDGSNAACPWGNSWIAATFASNVHVHERNCRNNNYDSCQSTAIVCRNFGNQTSYPVTLGPFIGSLKILSSSW